MTTVRVTRLARDQLNQVARHNSLSATAQLNQLIEKAWWEHASASERAAAAADQSSPTVVLEESLWAETASDGLT